VAAEDVPPTAQPVPRSNVTRPDVAGPCLTPEEALAGAPDRDGDLFRVPPLVEADE
jgi:aspartyl-tRNA(Asn)/glutamyl-tRNA(Gln) amidotransferase subunit C